MKRMHSSLWEKRERSAACGVSRRFLRAMQGRLPGSCPLAGAHRDQHSNPTCHSRRTGAQSELKGSSGETRFGHGAGRRCSRGPGGGLPVGGSSPMGPAGGAPVGQWAVLLWGGTPPVGPAGSAPVGQWVMLPWAKGWCSCGARVSASMGWRAVLPWGRGSVFLWGRWEVLLWSLQAVHPWGRWVVLPWGWQAVLPWGGSPPMGLVGGAPVGRQLGLPWQVVLLWTSGWCSPAVLQAPTWATWCMKHPGWSGAGPSSSPCLPAPPPSPPASHLEPQP